jgi:hypothetical protein
MPFMFENLEVFQKAVDLSDRILGITKDYPRGYGFLADQLNRAQSLLQRTSQRAMGDSQRATVGPSS